MNTFTTVTSFDSPVKTINGEQLPADIYWQFDLPPSLDTDKIKINVDRLQLMHRVGGIAMSAVTSFQGEQTEFTPGIAGINADGSALATKAGVTIKADPNESGSVDGFSNFMLPIYGQVIATHKFNKTEMTSKVSDGVGQGKTRESVWAEQLDMSLRQSVKAVGKANLMGRESSYSKVEWLGFTSVVAAAAFDSAPVSASLYAWLYGLKVMLDSVHNKHFFNNALLPQRRWSAVSFNTYQPDRYLALSAMCAIPGLITTKK